MFDTGTETTRCDNPVAQDSSFVSSGQVDEFGTLVGSNNRPVQPLNAREVLAEGSAGGAVATSH